MIRHLQTPTVVRNPTPRLTALTTALAGCLGLAVAPAAQAINVQDDLTQAAAQQPWIPLNGACLTAGNGSGTVPACVGLPYYSGDSLATTGGTSGTIPDVPGQGALRFTDNYSQNGAILSNFTFPADQGISATFTTVTYYGDSGGSGQDGADGMSFFLIDGSLPAPTQTGSWGGSLGYSCSNTNTPYQGLTGAYVGLGIDEYGNFLNQGDNTATGYGYVPNRIGLRGAGSINYPWLSANYPNYYPANLSTANQTAAVQATCSSGTLWNYNNYTSKRGESTLSPVNTQISVPDYNVIPNANATISTVIANENSALRGNGTPITYNLQITQDGLLSLYYKLNGGTYIPVLTKQSISAANGALPATLRFGFAGSTGGSRNIHEITCFQATPADQSDSSAGVNTQQAAQVRTGTQVYLSYFHPSNWWGQLTSQNLTVNSSTGAVSISPTVNWDASCVLTGGLCANTGLTATAESPSSRALLTWNGTQGIPFEYTNLTSSQISALDAGDTSTTANRLNFLRGDRSNELTSSGSGLFRIRTSVLGDIEHSNPTWVGPPQSPYNVNWSDSLYPSSTLAENGTSAQTYLSFASKYVSRANIVYSGANDGLLHAFRSGAYDGQISSGNPYGNFTSSSVPNDGYEVLGYMPGAIVQSIHSATNSTVDYASPQYSHAFSVDATPGTGDLFYANAWHSWLAGSLGAGGSAVFVLDITDPSKFSEANAKGLVISEWTGGAGSNLPCVVSGCGANLGNTYGTPSIRRFHNGAWGVIFGNGYASSTGRAGVFVVLIDPNTSAMTAYYLDAAGDPAGAHRANGIAYVTPVDLDGDHIVDYLYAGDLLGNVWRFDVTSNNPSTWAVSKFGGTKAQPLFTTPGTVVNGGLAAQPISTRVSALTVPNATGSSRRLMIEFGTGQEFPATTSSATSYAAGQQAVYGIWDWDMSNWNSLNPGAALLALSGSTAPNATLTYNGAASYPVLAAQTITQIAASTDSTPGTRMVSNNTICWTASSTCTISASNNQYGWLANLPTTGEQVIYNPVAYQGSLVLNTTIPPNNSVFACSSTLPGGWTMAFAPSNGGTFSNSYFPNSNNQFVQVTSPTNSAQKVSVTGIALNATGTPSVVSALNNPYLVNQTSSGVGTATQINPPKNVVTKRLNWTQLR